MVFNNKVRETNMKQAGMSLIELMVTLTVLAIGLAAAVPSFQGTMKRNNIDGALEEFSSAIKFARSEAISQSAAVSICASSNQTACTGDWHDGWIIFTDADTSGTLDAGDTLVRVHEAIKSGYTLSFDNATPNSVTFLSRGFTNNQMGAFSLCGPDDDDLFARGLILQRTGSLRFAVDGVDTDAIREDANGDNFNC